MQRVSIFKLRHTWTGLFEDSYLAQLDRAIHAIDEKWPIVAPADSTPSTRPVIRASRAANLQVNIYFRFFSETEIFSQLTF